jgi:hypothetical protein
MFHLLGKRKNPQQQGITNYIDIKSIDENSTKVEGLGGKVVLQKMPVPGIGYFAICLIQRTIALQYGKQIVQLNEGKVHLD